MFVVISAVGFYQVGLIVVRRFIQITVGFDKAGAVKRLACIVADNELNVSFIKVTQLRRKRMANVLVGEAYIEFIVSDDELNVSFIKVTQLRRKRMANVLVGDHHQEHWPFVSAGVA